MSNLTVDKHTAEAQERSREFATKWTAIGSTTILCAALMSPLGALPLFDNGYFNLVALSIIWLHLCAGTGAALIVWGVFAGPPEILSRALNPVSVGLFSFGLLTLIPAIYSEYPLLVVLGSPQSGKGVLWFLDAGIFVALGCLIRDFRRSIVAVCISAISVIGIVSAILGYARTTHTLLLLRGGDSYAYLGLALPFLTLMFSDARTQRRLFFLFSAIAALCIFAANNNSAALIFIALWASFLLLSKLPKVVAAVTRLKISIIFLLILLIATTLSYVLIAIEFRGIFDSIDSRLLIADIAAAAQLDASPLEWLFGHGWGHTQSGLYRNLTESGTNLLSNKWDFLWRDIFHSHNLVLELVYETGVTGFTAFAVLLAALVTRVGPTQRLAALTFVLGYIFMNSVWFEFAHSVPFFALVLCALSKESKFDGKLLKRRATALVGFSSVMLVCLAASAALLEFAIHIMPLKPSRGSLERSTFPIEALPQDPRGNDFIRASLFRDVLRHLEAQPKPGAVESRVVVREILDDIEARIPTTSSPELLLVGLVIFNDANYDTARSWMKPEIRDRELLWDRLIAKHVELAPKRTDVLVVYLSWLAAKQRKKDMEKLVARILRTNANEPVGLYFKGVIDTQNPSNQIKRRGLHMIARAIENGVERYVEVPDWLKKMATSVKASQP